MKFFFKLLNISLFFVTEILNACCLINQLDVFSFVSVKVDLVFLFHSGLCLMTKYFYSPYFPYQIHFYSLLLSDIEYFCKH